MTLFLRYGAVARGPNAYVPPGARKNVPSVVPLAAAATIAAPPPSTSANAKGHDVPKVSINAPDGSTVSHSDTTTPAPSPSPAPSASASQKVLHLIRSDYGAIEEHYVMVTATSGCTPCFPRICNSREAAADAEAPSTGEE